MAITNPFMDYAVHDMLTLNLFRHPFLIVSGIDGIDGSKINHPFVVCIVPVDCQFAFH